MSQRYRQEERSPQISYLNRCLVSSAVPTHPRELSALHAALPHRDGKSYVVPSPTDHQEFQILLDAADGYQTGLRLVDGLVDNIICRDHGVVALGAVRQVDLHRAHVKFASNNVGNQPRAVFVQQLDLPAVRLIVKQVRPLSLRPSPRGRG